MSNYNLGYRQGATPGWSSWHPGVVTLLAVCIVVNLAGCAEKAPETISVAGQVLIDGEPLSKGYIRFVPAHARSVGSRIDTEGRFYLTNESGMDGGLPPGKHRIEVAASEPIDDVSIKWFAPKKYADFRTSGLEETIEAPTDSLVIELTWGDQEGPFIDSLDVPMDQGTDDSESESTTNTEAEPSIEPTAEPTTEPEAETTTKPQAESATAPENADGSQEEATDQGTDDEA